jgi:2-methylaconitate cis-trans-isomerase PrpF
LDELVRISAVIYRRGTSKAIFLKENDQLADPGLLDRWPGCYLLVMAAKIAGHICVLLEASA